MRFGSPFARPSFARPLFGCGLLGGAARCDTEFFSVDMRERPSAETLLAELGIAPRLTVYLASAPGAGKTRRIVEEALALASAGKRVAVGILETKGRPDLDALAAPLRRIPPRTIEIGTATFADFDLEAALADDAEVIVLDELAHTNLAGAVNAKRWQDALALRAAGRSSRFRF